MVFIYSLIYSCIINSVRFDREVDARDTEDPVPALRMHVQDIKQKQDKRRTKSAMKKYREF